ncbi:hypothetical protein COV06_00630 [Candidatus Uhrbacteria bacterium CG10_big_fil_rev_8_21_14_0_10_50_16]|uniref:Lipocalin-like domain-containing protein n=1 Tax=Candidatus Uhrbacteria bacterium CG10_big_fil_rev_8_21_14_0_10_50_16 TaxID=1975039 RepID=A0A2H0RMX1_9BACT|nr:MAG: hypothetical protein COV06_00630 [Candidatus Uhrbacteria bacterium CG10_big_fil_rev_8_21_14_0_10_50_16]
MIFSKAFGALALSLVLVGAGCWTGNPFAQCFATTPWNSCVNFDGVDQALIGTWTLDSVLIAGQTHPFSGRETTFAINSLGNTSYGAYSEDWTTELKENNVPGFPSSNTCESIGYGGGTFKSEVDLDLATWDPNNPTPPSNVATLKVYPAGSDTTLRCQATGIEVESSGTTPPLGTGPVSSDSNGLHMAYTYTVNEDWTVLTLSFNPSTVGVPISYTFVK